MQLTPEQELELGFRSELLLQSETFKFVVDYLSTSYTNNILLSDAHETKKREHNYLLHHALNDVVSQLGAFVQHKDALVQAREQEELEKQNAY